MRSGSVSPTQAPSEIYHSCPATRDGRESAATVEAKWRAKEEDEAEAKSEDVSFADRALVDNYLKTRQNKIGGSERKAIAVVNKRAMQLRRAFMKVSGLFFEPLDKTNKENKTCTL